MSDKIILSVNKEQIELALGCELEQFALYPEYEDGKCIGLEIDAKPKIEKMQIPICLFIKKNRL